MLLLDSSLVGKKDQWIKNSGLIEREVRNQNLKIGN